MNMNPWKLVIRNLSHFRNRNLTVVLGIAIASAVLTGSLMVGDSMAFNLKKLIDLRLGKIEFALNTGERYVTSGLAKAIQPLLKADVAPVLMLEGIAVAEGGQRRVSKIQVLGVDDSFDKVLGIYPFYRDLSEEEVIISRNLAARLDVSEGDYVLFRITKVSLIPLNAPFVSDEEMVVSVNLKVKAVAGDNETGRFNLRISQKSPYNAFLSLSFLNHLMDLENRANVLLFRGNSSLTGESIMSVIREKWSLADAGLKLRTLKQTSEAELLSERVFLDEPVLKVVETIPVHNNKILTYFVNSLSSVSAFTPYSFVSTLPDSIIRPDEVIVNRWLADDQAVIRGDSLRITYFTVGPLRRLLESQASFVIKDIVPIEGYYSDKDLMPEIPGLSDAGNCRDWEAGVPIRLSDIRDKDEKYWENFRGIPKAFISQSRAEMLWKNTFGSFTSVRFSLNEISTEDISRKLLSGLDPASLGFTVDAVSRESHAAAAQGVDFSQLFLGLSFFILVAAVILTTLLLILNLEGRREQVMTLSSLGISREMIRRIMYSESFILSVLGALLGLAFAAVYTGLVFNALNGIWMDMVRTDALEMVIRFPAIIKGFLISLIISWITLIFTIRRFLVPKYNRSDLEIQHEKGILRKRIILSVAVLTGIIAIMLIIKQILSGETVNAGIFFIAGGLMLVSILLLFYYFLNNLGNSGLKNLSIFKLGIRNFVRNRTRSLSIIILLSIGTFIIISTGANRKDLFINSHEKSSGTGGFLFFCETTVPVIKDLDSPQVRAELGLSNKYDVTQFYIANGDDASCLNLNRITNPRILGADPVDLKGRFSFISETAYLDKSDPWKSLEKDLPDDDIIPAIADETVIKWGLGKKAGDTLRYIDNYGNNIDLLLIGGIASSVFQGNVIIAKKYFLEHFPDIAGSKIFLIEADTADSSSIEDELGSVFRDYGMEIENAAVRLAEFNSVTNTYLSVFLVMGALAILIGTVGLGLILARSILERRKEIALLKAVGIGRYKILNLVLGEYSILLISGILIGSVTSSIATLPSLISPNTGITFISIIIIAGILLLNGILWILLLAAVYLKDPAISQALRNE